MSDPRCDKATEDAVAILLAAGMVLRSVHGHSRYLGWPGRSGVLRVSDHASGRDPRIHARVTLSDPTALPNEQKLRMLCVNALGFYLLKAPILSENITYVNAVIWVAE